ncbi:tyrosine-type recombinase/integrase [Vibrio alginolyticus]|uniref:tyrosine-type recombinase/integrase n=1 Tax=Vibrio alginolyticus TaxID=663 RepID=UPI00215CA598|nr:tyrosine-type recombinase/integrase [Vibrio alginolyticus]MCR9559133.1 tyrosine-type recombinase/integrase [Vibrio alginolyticus]
MATAYPTRSKDELLEIIDRLNAYNPLVVMFVEMEVRTGLRYSDISRLKFKDVMINGVPRESFSVVQSKALNARLSSKSKMDRATAINKSRVVIHVNEQLADLIKQLYLVNGHNELMFQSTHHHAKKGSPISIQYINQTLKKVAIEMKLPYQLSTHSLRKTFAKLLMDNGAGLNTLRDLLGHGDSKTTDNYIKTFESELKEHATSISF